LVHGLVTMSDLIVFHVMILNLYLTSERSDSLTLMLSTARLTLPGLDVCVKTV